MADTLAAEPVVATYGQEFTFDFVERVLPQAERVNLETGGYCRIAPSDCLLPRFVIDLNVGDVLSMEEARLSELTSELNDHSSGFLWFTDDSAAYQLAWRARLPCRPVSAMFGWPQETQHAETAFSAFPLVTGSHEAVSSLLKGLAEKPVYTGGWTSKDVDLLVESGNSLEVRRQDELVALVTTFEHADGVHVSIGGQLAEGFKGQGYEVEALKATARHFASLGKRVVSGAANTDQEALRIIATLGMPLIKRGWSAQLGTF